MRSIEYRVQGRVVLLIALQLCAPDVSSRGARARATSWSTDPCKQGVEVNVDRLERREFAVGKEEPDKGIAVLRVSSGRHRQLADSLFDWRSWRCGCCARRAACTWLRGSRSGARVGEILQRVEQRLEPVDLAFQLPRRELLDIVAASTESR